jgi:cytolysin (calcineurin-like family phosphatase)
MLTITATLLTFLFAAPATPPEPGVTFLVCADPHYGQDQWADDEALNKAAIDRMNAIVGAAYPASIGGGFVDEPRGVLVCGDLTDTGEPTNWFGYWFLGWREGFIDDYGRNGEGRIRYPVFEGFGNHDIHDPATGAVLDGIRDRNAVRGGLARLSSNGLHYSWNWGEVHLVNLNLYPGGEGDAENSLDFLIADLAQHVGDSGRPVVICHHYGFDGFSLGWWTPAERDAYWEAIEGYRVEAIFHGHSHVTGHRTWHGIDTYNVGRVKDQKYFVVRINSRELIVAERVNDGWGRRWRKTWRPLGLSGARHTGTAIGRTLK